MKLEIELTGDQCEALAQVLKRIGFGDIGDLVSSEIEQWQAWESLGEIRDELTKFGFNPR